MHHLDAPMPSSRFPAFGDPMGGYSQPNARAAPRSHGHHSGHPGTPGDLFASSPFIGDGNPAPPESLDFLLDEDVDDEPGQDHGIHSSFGVGDISKQDLDSMCNDLSSSQLAKLDVNAPAQLSDDDDSYSFHSSSRSTLKPPYTTPIPPLPVTPRKALRAAIPSVSESNTFGIPVTPYRSRSEIPASTPKVDIHPTRRRAVSQKPDGRGSASTPIPHASPPSPPRSPVAPLNKASHQVTQRGRLSKEHSDILEAAADEAFALLTSAASAVGRSIDMVVCRLNARLAKDSTSRTLKCKRTGWNLYTAYFHTPPYEEAKRLGIEYCGTAACESPFSTHITPTLKEHRSSVNDSMFQSFKEYMGAGWEEYLITLYELNRPVDKSIADRERAHEQVIKGLHSEVRSPSYSSR